MHDKSQIQNDGRENVTTPSNSKRGSRNRNQTIEGRNRKCGEVCHSADLSLSGVHFIGNSWNGSDYTHATTEEEILKIYGA